MFLSLVANGEHSGVGGDVPEDVGSEAVAAPSNVDHLAKPEAEDEDSEEGFIPVTRETTDVKAPENNKSVKDAIEVCWHF